ncbi:MAG TPA: tetratricopeptide repeat protein [Dongiaceae bacterium]|jgi:tetratricopeptide (TPR) repeat protein
MSANHRPLGNYEWLAGNFWRRPKWPLLIILVLNLVGGAGFFAREQWNYDRCRSLGRHNCDEFWMIPFIAPPDVAEREKIAKEDEKLGAVVDAAIEQAQSGNIDKALAMIGTVVEARPANAGALEFRADLERSVGQADAAVADYDRLYALHIEMTEQRHRQGLVLAEAGRIDEAIAKLDLALQLERPFYDIHRHRGALRLAKGDFAGAEADFVAAIELDDAPKGAVDATVALSAARFAQDNGIGAVTALANVADRQSDSMPAQFWTSLVSGQLGTAAGGLGAEKVGAETGGTSKDTMSRLDRDLLSFASGKETETDVLKDIPPATGIDQRTAEARVAFYLGAVEMVRGENDSARKHFQSVIDQRLPYLIEYGIAKIWLAKLAQKT